MAQDETKQGESTLMPRDDEFEQDLHGNRNAGMHPGAPRYRTRTANDIKELHERLKNFRNDELKQIPVIMEGERLEQGATYLDLARPDDDPFVASGDSVAQPGAFFVGKRDVDYLTWNRLTGVTEPERLDQAGN